MLLLQWKEKGVLTTHSFIVIIFSLYVFCNNNNNDLNIFSLGACGESGESGSNDDYANTVPIVLTTWVIVIISSRDMYNK